jgi:hypothetical protein
MPDNTNQTPIQSAWIAFVGSLRQLLVVQPDDRPLDQYLAFRDTVLRLVENQKFLDELKAAWPVVSNMPPDYPEEEINNALLMELRAFPLAVEVAQATARNTDEPVWERFKTWLGRGSTITGSVKDLLDHLPPWAKSVLTMLKELLDLFTGKN